MQGMQCLMCTADHIAVASELWCAMHRDGRYVMGTDNYGREAHLLDFRAHLNQAEFHTWLSWPQVSSRIRKVKRVTEDVLCQEDAQKLAHNDVYFELRSIWLEVMELRTYEREQNGRGD